MTIIAERGLFVRLLVQSGEFAAADAEVLADALDAATREPATKADLNEAKSELRAELAEFRVEMKAEIAELRKDIALLSQRIDANNDRLFVRFGGLMIALLGPMFAVLRLT